VPFLHGVSSGTVEASAVTAFVKQSSGARVMPGTVLAGLRRDAQSRY